MGSSFEEVKRSVLADIDAALTIPPEDLTVETYPIPGVHSRGGQHVGIQSGVRVTHASGVSAYVDIGRSQHRNKEIAMDMILSALTHPRFRA